MPGGVRRTDAKEGDLLRFHMAGPATAGEYHCSSCGYGVTVQAALPRCPMCQGESWEAAPGPLVRIERILP